MKLFLLFALIFGLLPLQSEDWTAPLEADNLQNKYHSNSKTIKKGKKVYSNLCWSCHGIDGFGDGPASLTLRSKLLDFTNSKFHIQSDGAIFWKITTGRNEMESFEYTLSKKQRWYLVNYLRLLKKHEVE